MILDCLVSEETVFKIDPRSECLDYLRGRLHEPGLIFNPGQCATGGYFLFCLHGPGLKAIQANPGQQFSTRADTHNMLEYCPGHANPCLHEEISTIFTPSHLANPGRPGSREGCPGLARCERVDPAIV